MLTKVPFYFQTTRKMVVAFGGLFQNLHCVTKDKQSKTQKIVNVPLSYANKEKWLVRLQQDPGLSEDIQITLPRMQFEIVGFDYDETRQMNKMNKLVTTQDSRNVYSYAPVPYNITFNLYSYTRTQEDNLQIMEQILPYFTPDMNLSIKVLQNPDLTQDCSLILNSVNTDDQYDGGFEDRRYIITTYVFTMKMNFFGPLMGTYDPENHFDNSSSNKVAVIKKVTTNVNTIKYTAVIDPFEANSDDPYDINDQWTDRTMDPASDFDTDATLP